MNTLLTAQEQAEDDRETLIIPGEQPPFFVPWCARCKTTVDKFGLDPVTSPLRMGVQATCHGETEGIWVSVEDLFKRKRLGEPVVMFRKRAFNLVR